VSLVEELIIMGSLDPNAGQWPALLAAGAMLLTMVAIRVMTGASFLSHPPMCVTRAEDPFGFWLGVAIPASFGLALCVVALVMLAA
jgi:hypothetical protein